MTRKTDQSTLDHAVALYVSGKSVNECAALVGVSRKTITIEIRRRGIELRSTRYPQRINTTAANAAARGRKATFKERCLRALTEQANPRPMSVHEARFAEFLDGMGADWKREIACGPYNLDFTVGPVAVEVLGGNWHAYKTARHALRSEYVLNAGWCLVYVWSTANWPLTSKAAEYVVSLANEASGNPSLIGEYRVIRGDAHEITAGRGQFDNFTNEFSPRGCL